MHYSSLEKRMNTFSDMPALVSTQNANPTSAQENSLQKPHLKNRIQFRDLKFLVRTSLLLNMSIFFSKCSIKPYLNIARLYQYRNDANNTLNFWN